MFIKEGKMSRQTGIRNKWFIVISLTFIFVLMSAAASHAEWVTSPSGLTSYTQKGKVVKGWKKIGGEWYHFNDNGILDKNKWIDKDYYVGKKGARRKGLITINNVRYYFSVGAGKLQRSATVKYNERYYRTDAKGRVIRNTWLNNGTYYAGSGGAFVKGFVTIKGKLYYFDRTTCKKFTSRMVSSKGKIYYFTKDGSALKSQRLKYKNVIYGFNINGEMVKKATLSINGKIYYFNGSGKMVVGPQTINGKQFYFYSSGAMAVNTTVTAGGYSYEINAKGVVEKRTKLTVGASIANYAQKFVGRPYVWGGTDPYNGADCSGFCYACYKHFGITLPRVADDQMHGSGKAIREKDMKPGDLIFFNTLGGSSNYACHVTMYIGNDKICHAANTKRGIVIDSLSWYRKYMKFLCVRRYW